MRTGGRPDAIVQLDLKETTDGLSSASVAGFKTAIGSRGRQMILSGGDWAAVKRLADSVAGLRMGFDPCDLPEASGFATPADVAHLVAVTEAIAPGADMIYLSYPLILAARAIGYDIVDAFHRHGQQVDAWTLNTDHPNVAESLVHLAECRVDQITTDEPRKIQELWE
jgi:glycerophosphoryl diester phosphodiesterase